MRNQPQVWFGVLIILLGVVFLLGTLFNFNVWTYCWPIGLIALGVLFLVRPRTIGPNADSTSVVLGDIRRDEAWKVRDEEFWAIIGGFNQTRGALLGGVLIGVLENLVGFYVSPAYKEGVALMLFLVVILFRPEGLLGKAEERKV